MIHQVETFLNERLDGLPEGHRDRPVLVNMLALAQQHREFHYWPEQLLVPVRFSDEERRVLKDDGAVLCLPQGETIQGQKGAKRPFWYVADGYEIDGKNRLLDVPSRPMEVAIYPDPEKFFVPGSFDKSKADQENLLVEDMHRLRRRLGLEGIGGILPEASEATEIAFRYFDATGRKVRLLGKNYGFRWVRTNTPTTESGSSFADVGSWSAVDGIDVDDWGAGSGISSLGAARWVVPVGNR